MLGIGKKSHKSDEEHKCSTHETFGVDENTIDNMGDLLMWRWRKSENVSEFIESALKWKRKDQRNWILYGWIMGRITAYNELGD
jgi:hypothetical protein